MVERVDIQKRFPAIFSTTRIKKINGQSNNRYKGRFKPLLQNDEKDDNKNDMTKEMPEKEDQEVLVDEQGLALLDKLGRNKGRDDSNNEAEDNHGKVIDIMA